MAKQPVNRILFVSGGNAGLAAMAAALANGMGRKDVRALHAGVASTAIPPLAREVLGELNLVPGEADGFSMADPGATVVDIVVLMGEGADGIGAALPGNPIRLYWKVADPQVAQSGSAVEPGRVYRGTRDELKRLIDDFFTHGYLEALLLAKRSSDLVMDHLSEGVIAHDMNRRIFYFNAAAERITGYKRSAVLNRDCHEVIPGGLCGGLCSFCDGSPPPEKAVSKEMEIVTTDGERRRIAMNVDFMADREGRRVGVMGCFRDLTREAQLARRLGDIEQFAGIVGRDPQMLALYDLIPELAESDAPVLIQGESGTGKELVAAALHNEGPRAQKMFVPVNCGALPEGLLESELFGHVKGSFTGAIRDKKGRFELADGGTIFLDEIGDISPAMQVKLLRVLQEGRFERVGSEHTVRVNVRIVSATHRDLVKEMAAGKFREDLFYRLSVVPLRIPPLRERRTDIPMLATHFLKRYAAGRTVTLSPGAVDLMMNHPWPGNVRELQNWLQFALIKCKGDVIEPQHLPPIALKVTQSSVAMSPAGGLQASPERGRNRLTPESVADALARCGGNKLEAAKLLGVSRATLYRFFEETPPSAS